MGDFHRHLRPVGQAHADGSGRHSIQPRNSRTRTSTAAISAASAIEHLRRPSAAQEVLRGGNSPNRSVAPSPAPGSPRHDDDDETGEGEDTVPDTLAPVSKFRKAVEEVVDTRRFSMLM